MIKISIIIPVYNAEKYITACLKSILRQSLQDIEVICIDDGSTDTTPELLEKICREDTRVTVLRQDNKGAGAARNMGILAAKGEFVQFTDADDYLLDDEALERMYEACTAHHMKICGGLRSCERDGAVTPMELHREECEGKPEGVEISYRDYQYDFHFHNYLYERKMLLENEIFFPDYRRFQDPPFFVKAMIKAERFYVVPVEFYCIRSGHQNYCFSDDKVNDIVRGLTDNLTISANNGLKELHMLTLNRLNNGYFINIVQHLYLENWQLFGLLVKANAQVRWEWVKEKNQDGILLIKPLRFLLEAGPRRYDKYHESLIEKGYGDIRHGWIFPYHRIPSGSRVVLYAAGYVGREYYEQLRDNLNFTVVLWVDKNADKINSDIKHDTDYTISRSGDAGTSFGEKQDMKISAVEEIRTADYDYIVIAVEDESVAAKIRSTLRGMGVADEKIVWDLSIE